MKVEEFELRITRHILSDFIFIIHRLIKRVLSRVANDTLILRLIYRILARRPGYVMRTGVRVGSWLGSGRHCEAGQTVHSDCNGLDEVRQFLPGSTGVS